MIPTNKFTETVNNAAPGQQNSSQPKVKQQQPINGSLENREVVLSKINHLIEQAFNESDETKNSNK